MEPRDYVVREISGDYAYLENLVDPGAEWKCVALALLPEGTDTGSRLRYELFEYSLV